MEKLYIICIEDQPEVLHTIAEQLSYFDDFVSVEECETADEAFLLLEEIETEGGQVPVIISDHVMPGMTGVKFFIKINEDSRFSSIKKILLTGQATHLDTIEAINQANIDYYIEKPWEATELIQKVSALLTQYIVKSGIAYQRYLKILDQSTLFDLLSRP